MVNKKTKNQAIFYFEVNEKGKPSFEKLKFLYKFLFRFKNKRMVMVIHQHKPRRSLAQNRALHAILTRISDKIIEDIGEEIGYTMLELKEIIKLEYLIEVDSNGLMRVKGTSELNKEEFTDFIKKIYEDWLPRYFPEIKIPTIEEYKILMGIDQEY